MKKQRRELCSKNKEQSLKSKVQIRKMRGQGLSID